MVKMTSCYVYLGLITGLLVGVSSCRSVAASDKADVVLMKQYSSLSAMTSLKFSSRTKLKLGEERKSKLRNTLQDSDTAFNSLDFAWKGGCFRSEVSWGTADGEKRSPFVLAYNGHDHQSLRTTGQKGSIAVGESVFSKSNPYGTPHPLTLAYSFVFGPSDSRDVDQLQKRATWAELLKNVRAIRDEKRDARDGVTLTFDKPDRYEVFFAADSGYLPIYWKLSYSDGKTSESEVTSTKVVTVGDQQLYFPLSIVGREWKDGKLRSETTLTVDPDTLKVNTDLSQTLFTITPAKQDRVIDADAAPAK